MEELKNEVQLRQSNQVKQKATVTENPHLHLAPTCPSGFRLPPFLSNLSGPPHFAHICTRACHLILQGRPFLSTSSLFKNVFHNSRSLSLSRCSCYTRAEIPNSPPSVPAQVLWSLSPFQVCTQSLAHRELLQLNE